MVFARVPVTISSTRLVVLVKIFIAGVRRRPYREVGFAIELFAGIGRMCDAGSSKFTVRYTLGVVARYTLGAALVTH